MEIKNIKITAVDCCPQCQKRHTISLYGRLEEMLQEKELKFFCIDHGAWFRSIDFSLKTGEITFFRS